MGKRRKPRSAIGIGRYGCTLVRECFWSLDFHSRVSRIVEDYQFIRIPVDVGAVVESIDRAQEESLNTIVPMSENPTPRCFRYIPATSPYDPGGAWPRNLPNVKESFMVFAYKPSDLLSRVKEGTQ